MQVTHLRGGAILLGAVFLAMPMSAISQAPNAGSLLQEVKPANPRAPLSTGAPLKVEQSGEDSGGASAPFRIVAIQISGNTAFDTATLHALVADAEGKDLTLAQLQAQIDAITTFYQKQGYPLARAIIPAQEIRDGVVAVRVIEARYGAVTLNNTSRVIDSLVGETLSSLSGGQPVASRSLDRSMLLLSDIPGTIVNGTLKPGSATGTSDIVVDVANGPAVTGNVSIDTHGSRYTGRARLAGTVNFISPLHHGDVLSLSALTSGEGVNYGRLSYETLLNGEGTRIGASLSALRYVIGEALAPLDAHGTADVGSLWAEHPFVRSRAFNLFGHIQYDALKLRDHIDAGAVKTDRDVDAWTLSLAGDTLDDFLSGGATTWSLGWTGGRVDFKNSAAHTIDAATAETQGDFSKWSASLSRLQRLGANDDLFIAASGQTANGNLDSSEKMIVGGPYSVRANDVGALSGDTVVQAIAELRHDLQVTLPGRWQAIAFVDTARVTVNEGPWVAGPSTATLSGVGIGFNWAGENGASARAFVATPIRPGSALVTSDVSVRTGAQIGISF